MRVQGMLEGGLHFLYGGAEASAMDWLSDNIESAVRERRFAVHVAERSVPGVLWTPPLRPPRGLVLLGHGAAGHKCMAYVVRVAGELVRDHGLAAAAIDGPVHGDRRDDPDASEARVFQDFRAAVAQRPRLFDDMIVDWTMTLDALQACEELAILPVGYWGLSMGTMLGLPFVAQEPRVRASVLGLMGNSGAIGDRLVKDAARLLGPVFFLVQWHDELIPRDGALALFDAIASDHKTLHANPGKHAAVPQAELAASEAFLAKHLADSRG